MNSSRLQSYAPLILRIGLVFVFLWFGLNQVSNPAAWTGLIPHWIINMGISAITMVYLNGSFEIVCALLLAFNIWTRMIAFLLFLHLASIVFDLSTGSAGITAVAVRDIGLAFATLALSFWGRGPRISSTSTQTIIN